MRNRTLTLHQRGLALSAALSALVAGTGATARAGAEVEILDRSFDTAATLLAYTEFELSGEPLAEALGLDLDVLDPSQLGRPTAFDYTAGIESYEYSEEAMYALDYQSRMGLHLVNGPANGARGGSLETLGKRVIELCGTVRYPPEELPLNLYPISVPYDRGVPEFVRPVNAASVGRDSLEILDATGATRTLEVSIPAYFRDFETLEWQGSSARQISPGALGAALLKETLWAQDFLGGMHTVEGDEEVEATASDMDADGTHALGVSAVDGMNGVLLTEIAWDKLWTLQAELAYDGKRLGAGFGPDYDARKGPVWFPHSLRVEQVERNQAHAAASYAVTDASSQLRDLWLLLWSSSEFYAFSDSRSAHAAQNPAFLSVFDGQPFPAAPERNRDADRANDVAGTDPFSLASNITGLLFENLTQLHFDPEAGTLVDAWDRKRGRSVTTYDAAYALVALAVFQRARDALPVGYAASEAGAGGLKSPLGKRALELIQKQASFIIDTLVDRRGLVMDRYDLSTGKGQGASIGSQFAAIRGLTAAFVATGDARFKQGARDIYRAVAKLLFDPALGTFADVPGKPTEHTPWTAAAVSGGLRALLLNLRNSDAEDVVELRPAELTERYVSWFQLVINGGTEGSGMQLAEWIGDSGENVPLTSFDGDSDRDGVPQITAAGGAHGTAMVLAARVRVSPLESGAASVD